MLVLLKLLGNLIGQRLETGLTLGDFLTYLLGRKDYQSRLRHNNEPDTQRKAKSTKDDEDRVEAL